MEITTLTADEAEMGGLRRSGPPGSRARQKKDHKSAGKRGGTS